MTDSSQVGPVRRWLLPVAGTLIVSVIAGLLVQKFYTSQSFLRPQDFLEYYAAGNLIIAGGDPYDADQIRPA